MKRPNLGETMVAWAAQEPSVHLQVLIGSRSRAPDTVAAADAFSDWDFQIATSQPEQFASRGWLATLGVKPLAYVLRNGRLGSVQKVSAVTDLGVLDLVVIPVEPLRGLARLVQSGQPVKDAQVRQALTDLSAVLAGGFQIKKGAAEFAGLYEFVTREIPPARLDDTAVCQLAEAFVGDYAFTCRQIERGELIAAQRWLHQQLAEANFRLLHELRLRRGQSSFPDARRLERLADPYGDDVRVASLPGREGLRGAVETAAATHRKLVAALVGGAWRWPDLSGLHLSAE